MHNKELTCSEQRSYEIKVGRTEVRVEVNVRLLRFETDALEVPHCILCAVIAMQSAKLFAQYFFLVFAKK